ncbi:hypothetical protein FOZ61_009683 [Perkinsus olseni]|uniref:Uncharacterized protein n=1 Tax=Perkinsus olseni TaxID=32597 RepID=A0A7J6LWG3_PEROL|nr:hypothetical protein FOZ61_009683 [Perkinsus olseni]KAF4663516.1 hypothetical protein FOL46_004708 [Perkinsus olseni]
MTVETVAYEVLPRCGIAYRTKPSFDAKEGSGRFAECSEVIEAVPSDDEAFVRLRDGLYLPLRTPDGRDILRRLRESPQDSVDKTGDYMRSFGEALEAQGVRTDDDPYLNAYASRKDSHSGTVPLESWCSSGGVGALEASGVEEGSTISLASCFDTKPVKIDVSDRPLLCLSVKDDEVAVGCTDHGVKVISVRTGRQTRELYSKRFGHTEWVTTVTHLPDGRIASGGMDSKICIWNRTGVSCVDLREHVGSISRLRAYKDGSALVSSSYDRSLRIWRSKTGSRDRGFTCDAVLRGHSGPVLDFIVCPNYGIVSGGRDSTARIWDAHPATEVACLRGHSKGHITALKSLQDTRLIVSGGQDSVICVWDPRSDTRRPLKRLQDLHVKGAAVSDIHASRDEDSLITVGADGVVNVLDARMDFSLASRWEKDHENFIYASILLGTQLCTAGGDGTVAVRDITTGQLRYHEKVAENALRCFGVVQDGLIGAGDDGNVLSWSRLSA